MFCALSVEMADSRRAAVVGRVVGILERQMHEHVAVFPVSEDLVCFHRVPFISSVCPSSPLVGRALILLFCPQESGSETTRSRAEKVRVVNTV